MLQPEVIEGTWEEIAGHAHEYRRDQRFRLVPLSSVGEQPPLNKPGERIRKGMFPQLRDLTEEDFNATG